MNGSKRCFISAVLLLSLLCCQIQNVSSFYDPLSSLKMNVYNYLQRRNVLFTIYKYGTCAQGVRRHCDNRSHSITQLFSTKSMSNQKPLVTGNISSNKNNIFKATLIGSSNSNGGSQLQIKKTGAFVSKLPEVYPSPIHFKRAMRKTREIKIDSNIKNLRNANRYDDTRDGR